MSFRLDFTEKALEDIEFYKQSGNKLILKKVSVFLSELSENPDSGTGKPEQLKHSLSGLWSRRINKEHRLIYEVLEHVIVIHSVRGHY